MKKLTSCGIDIEDPARFVRILESCVNGYPSLIREIYTENEIKCNLEQDSVLRFALGFSCKEAVFKTLGRSWINSRIYWQDIELLFHSENTHDDHSIRLNNHALELFRKHPSAELEYSFTIDPRYVVFEVTLYQNI